MLELRPSCEHCDRDLPPDSRQAKICSFECTFCADCADNIFLNVCPNCGGGFVDRPVRPAQPWKRPAWLGERPASTVRVHRPKDVAAHADFAQGIRAIAPHER